MRQTAIFSGTSHPALVESICDRLGQSPGQVDLGKFSNGETSVQIKSSIRNQDVFIVQSGSNKINDSVIELLIMCSACKGGSARSITAVMPYFPYSRQSKKKTHRGAITARMIANLLSISGVDHVITVDLHASQMQGFFRCPVDNLVAEPLIARWIKHNVPDWREGVVVSKNAGGTKRVTSLADALKVAFGIVTADRRKPHQQHSVSETPYELEDYQDMHNGTDDDIEEEDMAEEPTRNGTDHPALTNGDTNGVPVAHRFRPRTPPARRRVRNSGEMPSSPLARSALPGNSPDSSPSLSAISRVRTEPAAPPSFEEDMAEQFTDERARDVTVGRFVHGHIVAEDYPSPSLSAMSSSIHGWPRHGMQSPSRDLDRADPMTASFMSAASSLHPDHQSDHPLGGSMDAGASSDEEEEVLRNPDLETTITLVGNVRDRPVFIVDDMIDKPGSWIAAAETVVKRGGATRVYCMATHGLFGDDALQEMQECDCIDTILVTNSFPISPDKLKGVSKLVQIDVAPLLAEAIRRNHHGENLSQLYMHFQD